MRRLKLLSVFLIPLLIGSCHYRWTSPWLVAHGSSKAFDMAVGGWVLLLLLTVYMAMAVSSRWRS